MRRNQGFDLSAVWFLIIANLLLFIATTIEPELRITLGLQRAYFTEEPWTIVTNLFIHADIVHILTNMITLYFFGTYVTKLIGENKFLIIYFLGGLLGNVFYLLLVDSDSTIPVVGASGAVFAVGGALTVLRPKLKVIIFPIPAPLPLWIAGIGIFLILAAIPILIDINIAWQAHLGGLLLGLAAGFIFRKKQLLFF